MPQLRPGPRWGLAAGMLLLAAAAAAVGVRVTAIALDETLLATSAMRYTGGLPQTFFDDPTARATSRLYALAIMPLFEVFDGDVAIRLAKVANALLWASAAVPLALLARPVLRSGRAAAAAALLGVATPWVVLTTAVLTESLALPAFAWTVWAIVQAARRPVWWRDALAVALLVVALGVRVQLVALAGAHLVVVAVACTTAVRAQGAARRQRLRAAARLALRRFPVTCAALAVAALAVVVLLVAGRLGADADELLGTYATPADTHLAPTDVPRAVAVQAVALAAGVGVLPLVLALAWAGRAGRRREEDEEAWWLAVAGGACAAAVVALAVVAQHGYVGPATEERYFFYVVPLVWIAAVAAVAGPIAVPRQALAAPAVGLVVLLGAVTLPRALTPEAVLMAPAGSTADHLLTSLLRELRDLGGFTGLTVRDALFALGGAALVALWHVWQRPGRARGLVALGLPAVVQMGVTAFALAAAAGAVAGGAADRTGGASFAQRGWVDRAIGRENVQWLASSPRRDPAFVAQVQRDSAFFSTRVRTRVAVPGTPPLADAAPLDALPLHALGLDLATGTVATRVVPTVQWVGSPFAQVQGRRLAASAGGHLELVRPGPGDVRLRWRSTGLDPDGGVRARGARLDVWARDARPATVQLTFLAPREAGPGREGRVTARLGGLRREVRVDAADPRPQVVRLPVCAPRASVVLQPGAMLDVAGRRPVAAALVDVRLVPGGRCGA